MKVRGFAKRRCGRGVEPALAPQLLSLLFVKVNAGGAPHSGDASRAVRTQNRCAEPCRGKARLLEWPAAPRVSPAGVVDSNRPPISRHDARHDSAPGKAGRSAFEEARLRARVRAFDGETTADAEAGITTALSPTYQPPAARVGLVS